MPGNTLPDGMYLNPLTFLRWPQTLDWWARNTSGMSFMGLDWANKSADGAISRACGFVHSFLGPLEWRLPSPE